jgi:oxaloacetate decarboxylase alpha subunit
MAKILGNEKPIKGRPADRLEPLMPKVRKELAKDMVQKEEDYVSYALFPEVALRFFQWRKNPTAEEPAKPNAQKPGAKPQAQEPAKPVALKDEIDLGTVRELVNMIASHQLTELEWEYKRDKVRLRRGPDQAPHVSAPPAFQAAAAGPRPGPVAEPEQRQAAPAQPARVEPAQTQTQAQAAVKAEEIVSPMVGTVYLRHRPDAAAFVEKDDTVEAGQALCIIEAMKLMNEIQAEKKCRVVDILVEDGGSVEYGQPLMLVEPL